MKFVNENEKLKQNRKMEKPPKTKAIFKFIKLHIGGVGPKSIGTGRVGGNQNDTDQMGR